MAAEKRYLASHFGPISEQDVCALESAIGRSLPASYRNFLLKENGGHAHPKSEDFASLLFFGIYDGPNDLETHWGESRDRYKESILPIGEDLNQDHILLDLGSGKLHLEGEVHDFDHFLQTQLVQIEQTDSIAELIADCGVDRIGELLDSGAIDLNEEAKFGYTLIQYATFRGKHNVVEFFADRGANPFGCLFIMLDTGFCSLHTIKCLLRNGADPNERMKDGRTVFDLDSPWIKHIIESGRNGD
ncbi:SMI1/KNR4 family protein [Verrucomicrobiales bacterium BCK34]|nr:SMI1/KNR4 family protein [Verrucomicrobiales bacterium BCK34]